MKWVNAVNVELRVPFVMHAYAGIEDINANRCNLRRSQGLDCLGRECTGQRHHSAHSHQNPKPVKSAGRVFGQCARLFDLCSVYLSSINSRECITNRLMVSAFKMPVFTSRGLSVTASLSSEEHSKLTASTCRPEDTSSMVCFSLSYLFVEF